MSLDVTLGYPKIMINQPSNPPLICIYTMLFVTRVHFGGVGVKV